MKRKTGDTCYFVENNYRIIEATVTAVHGDFCVVKYGTNAGIRLRSSRLYQTPEEAHDSRIYHHDKNSDPYFYDY